MGDQRPGLDIFFATFGVAATVTPKDGVPVATAVIWLPVPTTLRVLASGGEAPSDARPRLSIAKSAVTALPIGSQVEAPLLANGPSHTWLIDKLEDPSDPETYTVTVHEDVSV